MKIRTCAVSEAGSRHGNEDAYGNAELMEGQCVVVADGAGGHRGGAVASRLAVDATLLHMGAVPIWDNHSLIAAINAAGNALRARQAQEPPLREMSSTVAMLCIQAQSRVARWTHLGDSRILFFRGAETRQLTRDHSVLQSLTDAGLVGNSLPSAKFDRTVLYAAVGAEGDTSPEVDSLLLEEGDAFLVCTDGTWGSISTETMSSLLHRSRNVQHWVESVREEVTKASNPSQDNYTAVGIWLTARDDATG